MKWENTCEIFRIVLRMQEVLSKHKLQLLFILFYLIWFMKQSVSRYFHTLFTDGEIQMNSGKLNKLPIYWDPKIPKLQSIV